MRVRPLWFSALHILNTQSLLLRKIHSSAYIVYNINSPDGFEGEEKAVYRPFWLLSPLEEQQSCGVRGPALQQLYVLVETQLPCQVSPILEWGEE